MIFSLREWIDNGTIFLSEVEAWKIESPGGIHEGRHTSYSSENHKNEIVVNVKSKLRKENNQET